MIDPLGQMTEKEFQSWVLGIATPCGWKHYHTHDSRRSPGGFPDLVLVRETVLFWELKKQDGKVAPDQVEWGKRLVAAGQEFAILRPSDERFIRERLTRRR